MEWEKDLKEKQENAKLALYQNPGYRFERNNRISLIIDIKIGTGTSFTTTLYEPLLIDKPSDIFLDSFTTFNALDNKESGSDHISFVLKIAQFNIQSNSNNATSFNSTIIPNTAEADNTVVVHKSKKFNFICSINPTTLTNINGTITNLNATPATAFAASGRFIAEFVIISKD